MNGIHKCDNTTMDTSQRNFVKTLFLKLYGIHRLKILEADERQICIQVKTLLQDNFPFHSRAHHARSIYCHLDLFVRNLIPIN